MAHERKYDLEIHNINKKEIPNVNVKNIYFGSVVSIDDQYDAMRIKVRIKGLDDKLADEELPYCHAFLPKFFFIIPKVGEVVRILLSDVKLPYKYRHWIGSQISQFQDIKKDPYIFTALSTIEGGFAQPKEAISKISDADGIFPKNDEIGLIGRDNTDIILRDKEVEIRAGKHQIDSVIKLNKINPAYIKLNISKDGKQSTVNILANKINLISHDGNPKFPAIINEKILNEIIEKARPLPYGDVIVEFLELFVKAFLTHVHSYANMPPIDAQFVSKVKSFDLDSINSKNIKIN